MEIKVYHQIMDWNEDVSAQVKQTLKAHHTLLVNVMGSPGAGKTSLITALIARLRDTFRIGVIEGDITTSYDAQAIAKLGIPSVELNTDGACHIEAMSIQKILPEFSLDALDVLFVENIGNLVCPAEFDTGAHLNLMILSVPEGHDKPLKYPLIFQTCGAMIVNKIDVLPYFDFDLDKVTAFARRRNPDLEIFPISAKTGEGVEALADWLCTRIRTHKEKKKETNA